MTGEVTIRRAESGRRTALISTLLACTAVVTAIAIAESIGWIGQPFNGFLIARGRFVAPLERQSWSGPKANLPHWAHIVAIDGEPASDSTEILGAARRAGPGVSLAYTFDLDGRTATLDVRTMAFTLTDYVAIFGVNLLNGLAFLGIGFYVALLRPRHATAQAMLLFCLSWGLFLITSLADLAALDYRALLAFSEVAAPASFLYLAMCFPTRSSWAHRRGVIAALVGGSFAMALVGVALFHWAQPAWIFYYRALFAWTLIAIVLAIALLWDRYRTAKNAVDAERIRIVFAGTFAAFAIPGAVLLGAYAIGAALPFDVLPAAMWLFPAAVAYAIVKRDLFEIDIFLRRSVAYAGASIVIFGFYVLAIGFLGSVFSRPRPRRLTVVSPALLACGAGVHQTARHGAAGDGRPAVLSHPVRLRANHRGLQPVARSHTRDR